MEDNGGLLRLSRLSAHYAGRGSAAVSPPSPLFAPLPDAATTSLSSPSPTASPFSAPVPADGYLLRSPLASQQRRDRSWSPSRDEVGGPGSAVPARRAGKKTLLLAFELAPGRKVTVPLEFAASVPVGASSVRGAARSAIRREAARARVPAPPRLDYVSVFCDATRRWVELEAFPLPLLEAQQLYAFGEGGGPDADARGFIPPPRPATRALSPREVRTQQLQEQQADTLTVHVAGDVGGRRINVPRVVSSAVGAAAVRAVAAAALEAEARRRVNAAVDVERVLVRGYDGRWRELLTGAGLSDGAQLYALQASEAAPPPVIPESRDDGGGGAAGLVLPALPLVLGSPAAAAVFSPAASGSPRAAGLRSHPPHSLASPGRATVERWSGAAAPSPLPPYASPLRLCDRGAGAPALTPRAAVRGAWASKYGSEGGGGGGEAGGGSSTAPAVARRGTGRGTRSGARSAASDAGDEGRESAAGTSVASVVEEPSVVEEEEVAAASAATSVAPPTATPASTRPPDPPLPPPSLSTDEGGGSGSDGSSTRQASASPLDIPG